MVDEIGGAGGAGGYEWEEEPDFTSLSEDELRERQRVWRKRSGP